MLVEDYVGQIREVAQVVIKGADQAVINVVRHVAVQVRVDVRLHELQGDVARLFMVVVLGRLQTSSIHRVGFAGSCNCAPLDISGRKVGKEKM